MREIRPIKQRMDGYGLEASDFYIGEKVRLVVRHNKHIRIVEGKVRELDRRCKNIWGIEDGLSVELDLTSGRLSMSTADFENVDFRKAKKYTAPYAYKSIKKAWELDS